MLISYTRGQTSVVFRVKLLNSSVTTGAGLTGLTEASAGLIIAAIADNEAATATYTQAAGNIETIAALGTYAAPTAGKCRFKEVDATNHKGLYEIQLLNTRFSVASCKSLCVSISGATNCAETDVVIPLMEMDPYDNVRLGITALPAAAADAAGGLPISDAGGLDMDTKLANTHEVTAVRMGALTDWIDGGRLDLLLDALPTTAMRGTDNAALAAKLEAYIQLLARKDAAIATDRATELAEINANEGSGAGAFSNQTDSTEAIRDTAPLGTAMRGTDNAALAATALSTATWTAARAGYLDKLNIGAATLSVHTAAAVWAVGARTLTAATNITSDGATIDQTKIANLDATISSRATAASQTTIVVHLTDIKGTGFVKDTNSLVNLTPGAPVEQKVDILESTGDIT